MLLHHESVRFYMFNFKQKIKLLLFFQFLPSKTEFFVYFLLIHETKHLFSDLYDFIFIDLFLSVTLFYYLLNVAWFSLTCKIFNNGPF